MTSVIEASNLTKRYGDFVAVDNLNLEIAEGEIFGFFGPNGAGKTTAILMLLGLTVPSEGSARIRGHDCTREPIAVKSVTGYLPESLGFYGDLSARENLLYTGSLNGMSRMDAVERAEHVLEQVGLGERAGQRVDQMSHGMRQRLGFGDVLMKRPQVVIMDEPTQGIDAASVPGMLNLITGMSKQEGITVMVSSHQLHYMQRICSRVGIISQGRLVATGTIEELARQSGGGDSMVMELEVVKLDGNLQRELTHVPGVKGVMVKGNVLAVECTSDVRSDLARVALEHGDGLLSMRSTDTVLEEIYLRYFQEE
jgi:ABC-2 type transport system ATP-binding protein